MHNAQKTSDWTNSSRAIRVTRTMTLRETSSTAYNIMLTTEMINLDVCVYFTVYFRRWFIIFLLVDQSWKQFVIHAQKKTKLVLLRNIVRTVKKSYAQNVLNGIYGVRHMNFWRPLKQSLKVKQTHKTYDSPRDKLYSIKHHVDYRNNQSGRLCVFHNAQKTSDWTNSSRAIRDLKSRYFKILMLIIFY
jgi:hypothetical protein